MSIAWGTTKRPLNHQGGNLAKYLEIYTQQVYTSCNLERTLWRHKGHQHLTDNGLQTSKLLFPLITFMFYSSPALPVLFYSSPDSIGFFQASKRLPECSLRINVSPRKGFWYRGNCWRICGTHFNQYHLAVGGSKINLQRINESLNAPLSLILMDVPLQRLLNVDLKNIHPPLLRHRIVKGRKSCGEM